VGDAQMMQRRFDSKQGLRIYIVSIEQFVMESRSKMTLLTFSLRREPSLNKPEGIADEEEAIQHSADHRGAEAS